VIGERWAGQRRDSVSIADTLAAARPARRYPLFNREADTALLDIARRIPAALARSLYLECRLAADAPRVDLILGIEAAGFRIIAGLNPAITLDPEWCKDPFWEGAAQLCRALLQPRSPIAAAVDRIWLEFDCAPQVLGTRLLPGVFFHFRVPATARHVKRVAVVRQAIDTLVQDGVPDVAHEAVQRSFAQLPRGAAIPYIGVFPGRDLRQLRLCVAGLDARSAPSYVATLGHPALVDEWQAVHELTRSGSATRSPALALMHFDVGADEAAALSVELKLDRRCQLRGQIEESHLLSRLVHTGLCSPVKRRALERWPGCSFIQLPHELWRSLLVRNVNHVKLIQRADRAAEVKAYLALHYAPYPRATQVVVDARLYEIESALYAEGTRGRAISS
jgi:hypothetical protein